MKYSKLEQKGKRAKYAVYLSNDDVRIVWVDTSKTDIKEVLEHLYPNEKTW